MAMLRFFRWLIVFDVLIINVKLISGALEVEVKPYPALVYRTAQPGTAVLEVEAYDSVTKNPLDDVMMATTPDAAYFELTHKRQAPKQWLMQVKKTIDKPVGYVFQFNVRGVHGSVIRNKDVRINVTEKNQFSPEFTQSVYQFLAYRKGFDVDLTFLGTVTAEDRDKQTYNSIFHYHILDPRAKGLFTVGLTTGEVSLYGNIPPDMKTVTFNVTAIDGGSPQLMGSTQIHVNVTDAAPPDIFCVAVDDTIARICWKDPTNGSYVMKYELLFKMDGRNATKIPVHVNGIKDETCSVIRGNQLGQNYTFTVRVYNGLEWSPDSLERKVKINRRGLYGECPQFSNCSVWEPCQNKGECNVQPDLSYTCNCTTGWGGQNCTGVDLCDTNPCDNNGRCRYTGDGTFDCDCPSMFYGNYCQYFNVCTSIPCDNSATCLTDDIGNYTCICEDTYTGEHCETRDLCTPDPCVHGQCINYENTSFTCSCGKGYYGDFCEKVDICELNEPCLQGSCHTSNFLNWSEKPYWCNCYEGYRGENCDRLDMCEMSKQQGRRLCENSGTCMYVEVSSFRCLCTPGYWGGECQHYDMCINKPCVGGVCRNISDEHYVCDCHGGEYGSHCEHLDPCYNEPCLTNRSTCYNLTNTEYQCECPEERYGKNCEKIDGCVVQSCSNNGTCSNISNSGNIECSCTLGYYGNYCEDFDPCLLSPCMNNGTCTNITSQTYTCDCVPGHRGPQCELTDPCAPNPCLNDGVCVIGIMDKTSYWCMCPSFFYGTHCENILYCQLDHECQNGATCTMFEGHAVRNVTMDILQSNQQVQVSNNYKCVCTRGFTGERCEKISPCAAQPCGQGHCTQQGEGHICYCPDGTERVNCDDAYCEQDNSFYDKTGRYTWPRTKSGDVAKVTCHHGPRNAFSLGIHQYASRECAVTYNGDTYWKKPVTRECKELQEEEVSRSLRDLASRTRDASGLRPDQIADITETLEEFFYFSFENLMIAKEMTRVVGNLMDANETVIIESNSRNHSSDRLLWLLEEFTSKLDAQQDVSIETENINLKVLQDIEPTQPLEYVPLMENDEDSLLTKSGISLNLPEETLQPNQTHGRPRIELMTFRSSSFFIPAEDAPPQDIVMKQWVVTAVIHGRKFDNLTDPVDIMITNIKDGANHTCVYWDNNNATWSTEGVVTVERNISHTRCQSYHLTSFAIVLDPSPDHAISEKHAHILTYISYIGCGISIVGLILTLISYSLFRCLNREKSGKILMNLCLSMLLMNIIFIAGSEVTLSFSGVASCKAVAILLHYFLLTTLTWMLVEAINMYQALITVFTKYSGFFMLKRCILAWGIPAVIVIITVAIDDDNYRSSTDFCFLSQGNPLAFYIALLGPACVILLINIVVFVMVSRVILKPRFKGQVSSSDSINPAQIRGAFTVMTLLGVTWVFGPFAINEAKLVVNYVFTILNSLQGFLIFVFRCCFNPEVRMAWVLLVKTGKFKRRKGPIKGYSTDTTSKGDSKINASYSESLKSDMYNSSGKPKNLLQNDRNRDTATKNRQAKASKDLHKYFNDFHRIGSGDSNGRRYVQSDNNGRRYSQSECNGRVVNQSDQNGHRSSPSDLSGRRGSQSDMNGRVRRYSQSDSSGRCDYNGVGVRRASNSGIATIYTTGNQNGMRRMSSTGFDEFTKL